MSKESIRVSEKHGVNPSMTYCAICGESIGLALHGRLPGDAQAPRDIPDDSPCDKCCKDLDSYKEKGFIFLIIDNEYEKLLDEGKKPRSPWLFFKGLQVVKRGSKIFDEIQGVDLSQGVCFTSVEVATKLGLYPIKEISK